MFFGCLNVEESLHAGVVATLVFPLLSFICPDLHNVDFMPRLSIGAGLTNGT